jgi:hypothetical protein
MILQVVVILNPGQQFGWRIIEFSFFSGEFFFSDSCSLIFAAFRRGGVVVKGG